MDAMLKGIDQKIGNKGRKTILYTLLEVACVFILCLVAGILDWTHLEISFSKLATWGYYEGVIQKLIMYICALLCGYFFTMEREELNNKEYYGLLDLYHELFKNKKDSFVMYIEQYFNPETKKKFIKLKAEAKLLKLDKHTKDEFKIEFNKALKSKDFDPDNHNWSCEKMAKYAKNRIIYTKLASAEYIEENWENISIKYPFISPHSFTYNVRSNDISNAEYRVENQVGKDFSRIIGRKIILSILFAIVVALFIIEPSANELLEEANGWIAIIIRYIGRAIMIAVNFVWGLYCGKEMFQDNWILPLQNRNRILGLYINWAHEHNETTYADQILEAYRNRSKQEENLKNLLNKADSIVK